MTENITHRWICWPDGGAGNGGIAPRSVGILRRERPERLRAPHGTERTR